MEYVKLLCFETAFVIAHPTSEPWIVMFILLLRWTQRQMQGAIIIWFWHCNYVYKWTKPTVSDAITGSWRKWTDPEWEDIEIVKKMLQIIKVMHSSTMVNVEQNEYMYTLYTHWIAFSWLNTLTSERNVNIIFRKETGIIIIICFEHVFRMCMRYEFVSDNLNLCVCVCERLCNQHI